MNTPDLYQQYVSRMHKVADLNNANAVLQWDQETYLPPKGASFRGQQISTLSELSHQLATEDSFGSLLTELSGKQDLSPAQKRNIERSLEDYTRSKKYPSSFVRAMAEQVNKTFHAWIEARKQNSFNVFQDDLAKLVELKKQETELLGYSDHPYNALLDEFEKGSTVALLDKSFAGILPRLKEIMDKIAASPQVNEDFLHQRFPKQEQWDWGMFLLKELNFDFESGRQDISEHPFSISFSPSDVRITTRVDENDFSNMTWSCIHEAGHALYEQGLPQDQYGLPLGQACSYSIHESQSRLWENNVGRGRPFWNKYFPVLKETFPGQFRQTDVEAFFRGINKVQPSLVRTEADEISYHMHVFIRYELEKKLIEGSLSTKDIPAFWKEKYHELLGVEVKDDKRGSLQDVHWSHGSFGYFPTYSLGSFYAAQFYATAVERLPGLEEEIANGKFINLLEWLRQEIHAKGRYYNSEELCNAVTGKTLDVNYFVDYLLQKYASVYNL
jgi:carboxypeptidase Taq